MSKFLIPLTSDDMPSILQLANLAYNEMMPYRLPYSDARIHQFLAQAQNVFALGLCDLNGELEGILLGTKTQLSMSFSPVAVELLWYIKPEYRKGKYALQMVREFEKWAKSQKCEMITMSNLNDDYMDRTGRFYERIGYSLSEQTYYKDLNVS